MNLNETNDSDLALPNRNELTPLNELNALLLPFRADPDWKSDRIEQEDLLPDGACMVLRNVLSASECEDLIRWGESHGFEELGDNAANPHRRNERIVAESPDFCSILWERIRPYLRDFRIPPPGSDALALPSRDAIQLLHQDFHTIGSWRPSGLNPRVRMCRYNPDDYFRAHYDEGFDPDPAHLRTMVTSMVYLNESGKDFAGGETIFHLPDGARALRPETGMCLIFNQRIWHEGAVVTRGQKLMIRTDVYYERTAEATIPDLTEAEHDALRLFCRAGYAEKAGQMDQAIDLYRRAERLVPGIAELYGRLFD